MAPRKPELREEARRLRQEYGTPLKRIAARLGVSVSTAWLWTSDIELSAEPRRRNLGGPRGPQNPAQIAARVDRWKEICVCTISVHSTRLVQHIYGAIQEYGGFEEPRWLDGPPRRSQARRPSEAA